MKTNNKKLFSDLIKGIKNKETAFFCGAGISIHSGLPSANDLSSRILNKLGLNNEGIKDILNSDLPFEAFIQTVRNNINTDKIIDIFSLGKPNTNHILLARLMKSGLIKTICTTNFDQLIEHALANKTLGVNSRCSVFYDEAHFNDIRWNDNKKKIIKIHGSIENRKNMAITLSQVANQQSSVQRHNIIKNLFSLGPHKNVIIIGYSCSDLFDITPNIEAIRNKLKKVFFIEHSTKQQDCKELQIIAEDIREKKGKNPFRQFEGSWRLYSDTDLIIKTIWNSCLNDEYFETKNDAVTIWKENVDTWANRIKQDKSETIKLIITGQLYDQISNFEKARQYFEIALKLVKQKGNLENMGVIYGNLSNIFHSLGKYQDAIGYANKTLIIAKKTEDSQLFGNTLSRLGNAYEYLGDYKKAIKYYKRAHKILNSIGDIPSATNAYSNYGFTFAKVGNFKESIFYLKQALQKAKDIGNKHLEGGCNGNVGIVYKNLGDHKSAIEYHKKALQIAKDIGSNQRQGIHFGNLGNSYYHLSQYEKAIESHKEALDISQIIGDRQCEGATLGNIGLVYNSLRKYEKALKYFNEALKIAKDIGDKQGEGSRLTNIGLVYFNIGNYDKALKYYKEAYDIFSLILEEYHPHIELLKKNIIEAKYFKSLYR